MAQPADLADLWTALRTRYSGVDGLDVNSAMGDITITVDALDALMALSVYQGFNPEKIFALLCRSNIEHQNDSGVVEIRTAGDEGPAITLAKNAKLNEDVIYLLTIFASRGSVYQKLTKRPLEAFKALVDHLVVKYDINTETHAPGQALDPELVTIPRIAAVFPTILVNLYHQGKGKQIFPLTQLGQTAVGHKVLSTTFLVSCIDRALVARNLAVHNLLFAIHYCTDIVLHRNTNRYTEGQNMLAYYIAGYRSEAVPDASRRAACIKWGIITHVGNTTTFSDWFMDCVEEATFMMDNNPDRFRISWDFIKTQLATLTG